MRHTDKLAVIAALLAATLAGAAPAPPIRVDALVPKSGKLVIFGTFAAQPSPGASYQIAPISAVKASPTVYRNGQPATIGPATWYETTRDTAFVAYRIEGDVAPGDVITYNAPAGWIGATLNGVTAAPVEAVAGGSVANWSGRVEGDTGGFVTFGQPLKIGVGANVATQGTDATHGWFWAKNHVKASRPWATTTGAPLTPSASGMPTTWGRPNVTQLSSWFHGPSDPNYLDSRSVSPRYGQWTITYDDPGINTPSAMAMWVAATGNITATPFNLSGPNKGTSTPLVIDPRDVTIKNGSLLSIKLANTDVGTGWQGAIIVVGGVWGAAATAQVVDGTVAGVTILCPGSGATGPATISLYGTLVGDSTVTMMYDVGAPADPPNWTGRLLLYAAAPAGADGLGRWTAGNLWIVAPNAATRKATLPVDRSDPLAPDDSVLRSLTSASGKTPAVLRFMDATQGYGGLSNVVFASHLVDPAGPWTRQTSTIVPLVAARRFAGSKVYGPQPHFVMFDRPSSYLPVAPGDGGTFAISGPGAQGSAAIEFRSAAPHGLVTGQYVTLRGNGAVLPITNTRGWTQAGGIGLVTYVTGPDTIVLTPYLGTSVIPGTPVGSKPQVLDAAGEIDLTAGGTSPGWTVQLWQPYGSQGVPYEVPAAMVSKLPGTALWVNFPLAYTDELVRAIARKTIAHIGPTNPVYLEYSNEPWNGKFPGYLYYRALCTLLGNLPPGRSALGHYLSRGTPVAGDIYGPVVLLSAHAFDLFEEEWVRAGLDPSRLHRAVNIQFGSAGHATAVLDACRTWGVTIDHLAMAPYFGQPISASVVTAFSASGGAWPVDAINDMLRYYAGYNNFYQSGWGAVTAACRSYAAATGLPAPTIVCYEGGMACPVPAAVPGQFALLHDCLAHPSARDLVAAWYAVCQRGCQWMPGSGAEAACYFTAFTGPTYPQLWYLAAGVVQPPGDGLGNRFATAQGGPPADGKDHNGGPSGNVSPALQAFRDAIEASASSPGARPVSSP